jgi:Domain of unknown function (DUF1707)/2TM domain
MERTPDGAWRVGDDEREQTVALLHEHASSGRLDPDELGGRVEAALSARTRAELAELVTDLPAAPAKRPRPELVRFQRHLGVYVVMSLFFIAIWALSGGGSFWPAWAMLGWGIAVGLQGVKILLPGDDDGSTAA